MQKIIVLTGAGISAESGISTFRDAGGLWEGHDVMAVASPEGWERDPEVVLNFYNERRRQLNTVQPNAAHLAIQKLEEKYEVVVITQNVDDLHERAGSSHIIHLHGELKKVRSTGTPAYIQKCDGDILLGDQCQNGYQLRPHIVWFGEMVPMLEPAIQQCETGDIFLIIGTSMQVYPAAGLIAYARLGKPIYYIDPHPNISHELRLRRNLQVIEKKASIGVLEVAEQLLK
ncbi:MAG: NAD-dependent deacylase [Saprospiraceae bacterium]